GLAAPTDRVMLTISGKISVTNVGNTAQFDRAMLEALGLVSFETATPWHSGPQKFEGVSIAKLLRTVGASGDRIQAIALNDYTTEIPVEDFTRYNVILALKRNNEYMPVRDKGPLFIVYPYDSDPELRSQKYYSRSAWQLAQIIVR
ncbi:MAG: molybdopterin-dependent oxidoreductase, partial [Phreatobacter sp.]